MSVIVELALPATEFQLGRILSMGGETTISLETMVPLGDRSIPFFRLFGPARETFEAQAQDHHSVADIHVVSTHDGETLYALDWESSEDSFLNSVLSLGGHVLEASADRTHGCFNSGFHPTAHSRRFKRPVSSMIFRWTSNASTIRPRPTRGRGPG